MAPFIFRIINLKRCYSYSANSPRHPSISARGGEPPLHRHSTFVTRSMGPLGGPMGQPWCPPCQGSGVPRSSGGQNAQRQFARCAQPWSPLPVPTPSHLGGPRSPALSPGASRCGSISNLRNQLVPVCRGLNVIPDSSAHKLTLVFACFVSFLVALGLPVTGLLIEILRGSQT